jgi:hypothetical protein
MKLVIFGLTVSSSWGNGHATLWRGLVRALAAAGHDLVFFERDVPYYAATRDLHQLPRGGELVLYPACDDAVPAARRHLASADAAIVTSYQADALAATELVLGSPAALRVFYDLDTPVTLDGLRSGRGVAYVGPRGLRDFDNYEKKEQRDAPGRHRLVLAMAVRMIRVGRLFREPQRDERHDIRRSISKRMKAVGEDADGAADLA